MKLIDGIGSVTAQHSCHLCYETRQEREDFTRSRSAWPEPRTIYGMDMQNVAICSLHGNLRVTETLIKLTFELIVSLLFPTEPPQASSAANEGGVDDEDANVLVDLGPPNLSTSDVILKLNTKSVRKCFYSILCCTFTIPNNFSCALGL